MKADSSVFLKQSEVLPFVEVRQASQSSACYHAHSHDEFSFGVIDAGVANYHILKHRNRIILGDTVTINPGDIHSCNPLAGEWSYRMLFIDTGWVGQLQEEIFSGKNIDFLPFESRYLRDIDTYNDFDPLYASMLEDKNPLVAESLLIKYLSHRFRHDQAEKSDDSSIAQVKQMISDQLHINHSLTDLAQECGISRYHLIRSFKRAYGLAPHAYQLDERIKGARTMLKAGHSLTDTAQHLGFADQSHLHRNFKKRLAITPKQYQAFFV